jgi:hypothetical protein
VSGYWRWTEGETYRRIGVSACGRVGVWACGRVGVWACGRVGVVIEKKSCEVARVKCFPTSVTRRGIMSIS